MAWYTMGNNIFNEVMDNNDITKDEIYTFVNIGAYQQGNSPGKTVCAVTPENNINYLNITS